MIVLASTFIVGCSNNNDTEKDTSENENEQVVEEVIEEEEKAKKEAKVFIQEGPEEISIRSENIKISKLSLVSLEYNTEEEALEEKEILKEKEAIEEDKKITWDAVYSEGIPSMKLAWELSNGDEGEYVIFYDGKDGLNTEEFMVYPEDEKDSTANKTEPYISELVNFSEEERRTHHENLAEAPENISEKVYEHLMLPGIHENTRKYEGRINPSDHIRFTFPDAENFAERTSYDPEISEEGYFTIDLGAFEFDAGQEILVSITKGYHEEQNFILTVHEAKEAMEDIRVRE